MRGGIDGEIPGPETGDNRIYARAAASQGEAELRHDGGRRCRR